MNYRIKCENSTVFLYLIQSGTKMEVEFVRKQIKFNGFIYKREETSEKQKNCNEKNISRFFPTTIREIKNCHEILIIAEIYYFFS